MSVVGEHGVYSAVIQTREQVLGNRSCFKSHEDRPASLPVPGPDKASMYWESWQHGTAKITRGTPLLLKYSSINATFMNKKFRRKKRFWGWGWKMAEPQSRIETEDHSIL